MGELHRVACFSHDYREHHKHTRHSSRNEDIDDMYALQEEREIDIEKKQKPRYAHCKIISEKVNKTESQIDNTSQTQSRRKKNLGILGSEAARNKSNKETQEKQQIRQGGPADTARRRGGY
jgi:hypothetical protein